MRTGSQRTAQTVLNADRWHQMIDGAELVSTRIGQLEDCPQAHLDHAIEYLESVLEAFPSSIDPVQDLEGYAIRRMARAVQEMVLYAKDATDV